MVARPFDEFFAKDFETLLKDPDVVRAIRHWDQHTPENKSYRESYRFMQDNVKISQVQSVLVRLQHVCAANGVPHSKALAAVLAQDDSFFASWYAKKTKKSSQPDDATSTAEESEDEDEDEPNYVSNSTRRGPPPEAKSWRDDFSLEWKNVWLWWMFQILLLSFLLRPDNWGQNEAKHAFDDLDE